MEEKSLMSRYDYLDMPTEASSYSAMTMGSVPLPDVVLESTDSVRRIRSFSVNLPPDRAMQIQSIGRNLVRMSEVFEMEHNRNFQQHIVEVRRRTTSDCHELRRHK